MFAVGLEVRYSKNPTFISISINQKIIGSLVGSLKLSGEEITKEKFSGGVTDWSIGNWNNSLDSLDRELGNAGNK